MHALCGTRWVRSFVLVSCLALPWFSASGSPADEAEIQALFTQMGQYASSQNVSGVISLFSSNYLHCGETYADISDGLTRNLPNVESLEFSISQMEVVGDHATVTGIVSIAESGEELWTYAEPDATGDGLGLGWVRKEDGQWKIFGNQRRADWYAVSTGHNLVDGDTYFRIRLETQFSVNSVVVNGAEIPLTSLELDPDYGGYTAHVTPTNLPPIGTLYTFEVDYADGVHETLFDTVKSYVNAPLTISVTMSNGVPVISWPDVSASVPNAAYYRVTTYGSGVSWEQEDIPLSQTSIVFNEDGTASGSLQDGETYWASISIFDESEDYANISTDFVMSGEETTYTVTFDLGTNGTRSGGGELVQQVVLGGAATAPTITPTTGWAFTGWDKNFSSITSNLMVSARYIHIGTGTLHYVSPNGTSSSPYLSLLSAATNIQDAVNVSVDGDTILVSDGHYLLSSGIIVDNAITITSLNGPEATIVDGSGSSRCFNLGSSLCVLSGFTITNGYTALDGGGVWAGTSDPVLTNCLVVGNAAGDDGGGVNRCTIYDCIVSGNIASNRGGGTTWSGVFDSIVQNNRALVYGGGLLNGYASNCVVRGNIADDSGGGMRFGTADHCVFSDNTALINGGGVSGADLRHCDIFGNHAMGNGGGVHNTESLVQGCNIYSNTAVGNGGGVKDSEVYETIMYGNAANEYGGGGADARFYNCLVYGNRAGQNGGGLSESLAINCTIVENHANQGGGVSLGSNTSKVLHNCIVYNNSATNSASSDIFVDAVRTAPAFYSSCSLNVEHGIAGCITNDPAFVDSLSGYFRLLSNSPCINWGNNAYATHSVDLDGNPRVVESHVDMGCYEFQGIVGLDGDQDGNGYLDSWEREHFDGHVDPVADHDGDGQSNGDEYIAGTNPTNGASLFKAANSVAEVNGTNCFVVEWISIPDRSYSVLWSTNLTSGFQALETGIEHPLNSYTDTVHSVQACGYYKVDVRLK